MQTFDLIVVGAGSGTGISSRAAARGWSTALVERGPFGGTCINNGCVGSKWLIHSADVMLELRGAARFGLEVSDDVVVDWQRLVRRVEDHVHKNAAAIEQEARDDPHTAVVNGEARFVAPKTLEVHGEQLQAETIVLSAGSRPRLLPIEGLDAVEYITSEQALHLPEQPRSLAIVGGGAIASELAHFFGALGTPVTLIERGSSLLGGADQQVARRFTEVYQRRFDARLGTEVARVAPAGDGVALELTSGGRPAGQLEVGTLLLAAGRIPNSDTLDLTRTGVEVDERGFVKTDAYLQTTVPGIWATGDIAGRHMLKHAGDLDGDYVAHNIFNPDARREVDHHGLPQAIFGSPQVASVGLAEREVRERGRPYLVGIATYESSPYGGAIEDHDGFVKALVDAEDRQILGCHIIGAHASVLIQEIAIVMRLRATADAITDAIYVHPALQEVLQKAFKALAPPA